MRDCGGSVFTGRTRRDRRPRLGRAAAGLLAAVVGLTLAGCQSASGGLITPGAAATPPTAAAGMVLLAVPVEVRQLLHEYPCAASTTAAPTGGGLAPTGEPATVGTMRDLDGADCFQLSAPLLTLQRLNSISIDNSSQPGESVIDLGLTKPEADSLAALTGGRTGEQLAVVVRGTVLATPDVTGPTGSLQIADDFSPDDAQRLMRQITG